MWAPNRQERDSAVPNSTCAGAHRGEAPVSGGGPGLALRVEDIDQGSVDLDRDRLLVLRYQSGDEAAFDELYRRYYPRLHPYCQRRVHDTHVSVELAQT